MILLVGATGRLGKAVAERLLQQDIPFRAAARTVAKAQWLAERGVEVLPMDLGSGTGVPQALAGITRVLSCVHGLLGRSRHSIERIDVAGTARLIDASAEAGVERFVYLSALGASLDHPSEFWRAKARTEQHLKASGLAYVILRPSAFMDLYAHDLIGAAVIRGRTVFVLGGGNTRRNMIAVADVADAALKALLDEDLAGRTIELGSPGNYSEREVAAIYAAASGNTSKVRSVPPSLLKPMAAAIAPFHAGVSHLLLLPMQLAGREDLCTDAASSMNRLGIHPVTLAEFAEQRIHAGQMVGR
jgi:NADH dehydrogenase